MVGDFLIGDIMSIKYEPGKRGILIELSDVKGDFIECLDDAECTALVEGLDTMLKAFCSAVEITRAERSQANELESKDQGDGRG